MVRIFRYIFGFLRIKGIVREIRCTVGFSIKGFG